MVLATLGATFIMFGLAEHQTSTANPPPTRETPIARELAPSSRAVGGQPASKQEQKEPSAALPKYLRIPAIGVSTNVISLGLKSDKTVQVPKDASEAGWFKQGPVPGQLGSSVILGHVDSTQGPAVFYQLRYLKPGNQISVRLSDGAIAHFKVARVATYLNENFPATKVYAGSPGRPTLNLVTCGGEYKADAGGYQSNVVAFTDYVRTTPRAT